MITRTYCIEEVDDLARTLLHACPKCMIFTFTGSLGAGKTTLVQALLRACGVTELITSPTFSYVNIYTGANGKTLYHFDCYRIPSVDDFIQAGFNEYLYTPNSICFIEWPEVIMPLLTHKACHCILDYKDNNQRVVRYTISNDSRTQEA